MTMSTTQPIPHPHPVYRIADRAPELPPAGSELYLYVYDAAEHRWCGEVHFLRAGHTHWTWAETRPTVAPSATDTLPETPGAQGESCELAERIVTAIKGASRYSFRPLPKRSNFESAGQRAALLLGGEIYLTVAATHSEAVKEKMERLVEDLNSVAAKDVEIAETKRRCLEGHKSVNARHRDQLAAKDREIAELKMRVRDLDHWHKLAAVLPPANTPLVDQAVAAVIERDQLRAEVERERMRLAACGVVANANTAESAAKAREMHPNYRSASCDDVARAVDREMQLRAEVERLLLEGQKVDAEVVTLPGFNPDGPGDCADRVVAAVAQLRADNELAAEALKILEETNTQLRAQLAEAQGRREQWEAWEAVWKELSLLPEFAQQEKNPDTGLDHALRTIRALADRANKAEAEVEQLTKENFAAHEALRVSVGHLVYDVAVARAETAEAQLAKAQEAHSQLLYAVQRKFEGETRHQTALRYIQEAEAQAKSGTPCSDDARGGAR